SRRRLMSSPRENGRMGWKPGIGSREWRIGRTAYGKSGVLAGHSRFPTPHSPLLLLAAHAASKMRGAAHVGQLDLADGADALLGHAVGGFPGRDAVALGDLKDAAQV